MNQNINCQVEDCPKRTTHPSGNGSCCGSSQPITISPEGLCTTYLIAMRHSPESSLVIENPERISLRVAVCQGDKIPGRMIIVKGVVFNNEGPEEQP
jgi:hypothetical protein